METAFQGNAFQNDAFQIATAVNRLTIEYCFDLEMAGSGGYPLVDETPTGQYRTGRKTRRAQFETVEGFAFLEEIRKSELLRYSSMEEHRPLEPTVTGSSPVTASTFTLADQLHITGTKNNLINLRNSLCELDRQHDHIHAIQELIAPAREAQLTAEEEELVLLMMMVYDEQLC